MYQAEYTDTFAGQANYCWVDRAEFDADTLHKALRRARSEFGLTGVRGDITGEFGDEIWWTPRGSCTVLIVSWIDA